MWRHSEDLHIRCRVIFPEVRFVSMTRVELWHFGQVIPEAVVSISGGVLQKITVVYLHTKALPVYTDSALRVFVRMRVEGASVHLRRLMVLRAFCTEADLIFDDTMRVGRRMDVIMVQRPTVRRDRRVLPATEEEDIHHAQEKSNHGVIGLLWKIRGRGGSRTRVLLRAAQLVDASPLGAESVP